MNAEQTKDPMSKNFETDTMPEWQRFSIKDNIISIILHVNAAEALQRDRWSSRDYLDLLRRKFGGISRTFKEGEGGKYGFNGVFTVTNDDPWWVRLSVPLPDVRSEDNMNIRATLNLITNSMNRFVYEGVPTGEKRSQLMLLQDLQLGIGRGGAAIGASFSPAMVSWLQTQPEGRVSSITEKMREAYAFMGGSLGTELIRTEIGKPKKFFFSAGHDACYLCSDNPHDTDLTCGCSLCDHNTDGPVQQFTLLVALCALYDLIRQESA